MPSTPPIPALALVLVLAVGAVAAPAVTTPEQARNAERILQLIPGVLAEYAEAFDAQGDLVRPIELEEAALLLAEARDLAPRVGVDAAAVAAIEKAIADRAGERAIEDLAAGLAAQVTAATGVTLQQLPAVAPSAVRGATLFNDNCASCHGADGAGGGEESQRLGLTPANFRDLEFMHVETPDDFFNVVTLGRRRSGMPAWSDALSVQERWDLVRYIWTFHHPEPLVARGRALLAARCPSCDTSEPAADRARANDGDLLAAIETGPAASEVAKLDAAERSAVVAAIRARAFDGLVGDAAPSTPRLARSPREGLAEVHRLLDAVRAARERGEPASELATDAYMRFEPYEKRLGAVAPGLVGPLEETFVRLRQAVRGGGDAREVATLVATLHEQLDRATTALEPGAGAWVRFVQSAGIILREGFEVVLVVGALIAYVRRSTRPEMVRSLYAGGAIGVVLSIVTAIVLTTVLRVTPWAGEVLEGAAMLLAAVVLFGVSYWLVSKAEADRWQRYIRGKVQGALSAGSRTALASAAFLAVYREGFETILFYQALFASAPAGDVMIPAGLVAGLVLLAVVYVGLERVGLRIPMRAFFLGTGAFLYAMAVVFAGRGVSELQEAGIVPLTALAWAPRIEALGIFPTVETLVAQGVFLVLLVYAIVVTLVRRRPTTGDAAETPPARKVAQG
jgi:high-affinity iron transporter